MEQIPTAGNAIGVLKDLADQLPNANPYIALISAIGVFLLFFHAKISYKVFHIIPAPVWVVAISVSIVLLYNYLDLNQVEVMGVTFEKPTNYLMSIPSDLTEVFLFPDFSRINSGVFWLVVLSMTIISSISLAAAKAIDKLDPYKRKTNLNKDLMGLGASTMVSGMLGGPHPKCNCKKYSKCSKQCKNKMVQLFPWFSCAILHCTTSTNNEHDSSCVSRSSSFCWNQACGPKSI